MTSSIRDLLFSRRQFLKTALAAAGSCIVLEGCAGQPSATPSQIAPTANPTFPPVVNKTITQVGLMPNIPSPFKMRDWHAAALKFDELAFNFEAKGDYLPLIWWDKTHTNMSRDGFGLPAYVGDTRQSGGADHEGITCIGAVLGATVSGIDKSSQNGYDWVDMLEDYYNSANGLNLVLDSTSG